ncbi:ribokinase [Microbacterium forte]|uniref:ribokinase n=1 Tax=Microbacterium forte TaxID=2982533 RepID=UPI002892B82E|nr:ribokinase [Microbacterium sp. A(2022)]
MSRPSIPARSVRKVLESINGRVAVVGSANADICTRTFELPRPGETVVGSSIVVRPGGKSANQAVQAALLGANVSFVTAVGRDSNAGVVTNSLRGAGVSLAHVEAVDLPTGTALITVDDAGENTIVVSAGANGRANEAFVEGHASAIADAAVVGLCLEIPLDGVLNTAVIAKAHGTQVLLNLSPFMAVPPELIAAADVLVVNETELSDLLGSAVDVDGLAGDHFVQERVAVKLAILGVHRAIVTLGGKGALVLDGHLATVVPAVEVQPVDTTGCGDAFFGTVLAALASGATLFEACQLAVVVAGFAAEGEGAQQSYGSRDKVLRPVGRHR